jgi:hypothetical protein
VRSWWDRPNQRLNCQNLRVGMIGLVFGRDRIPAMAVRICYLTEVTMSADLETCRSNRLVVLDHRMDFGPRGMKTVSFRDPVMSTIGYAQLGDGGCLLLIGSQVGRYDRPLADNLQQLP